MDIFIEQLEEATGLGAVMDLLQDLLGGATDPAFLAVVAVAGRRCRLAPRWLSTEQPSRPRHWLWWSTAVRHRACVRAQQPAYRAPALCLGVVLGLVLSPDPDLALTWP